MALNCRMHVNYPMRSFLFRSLQIKSFINTPGVQVNWTINPCYFLGANTIYGEHYSNREILAAKKFWWPQNHTICFCWKRTKYSWSWRIPNFCNRRRSRDKRSTDPGHNRTSTVNCRKRRFKCTHMGKRARWGRRDSVCMGFHKPRELPEKHFTQTLMTWTEQETAPPNRGQHSSIGGV